MQGSSVARECILDILDIEQGVIMVTPPDQGIMMHRLHSRFFSTV